MNKLIVLLVLTLSTPVFAARTLPEGVYAQLDSFTPPVISLNGKEFYTSAAFQIRDQKNHILPPQRVPADVPVWVQVEPSRQDLIWRAWILSPEEVEYLKSIGRIKEPRSSLFGLECLFVKC